MPDLSEKLSLLGLKSQERQTYLYILKHKRVNLKDLSKILDISIPRASIITQEMIKKGFIKEFAVDGTRKIYMATDIEELRKEYLRKLENEKDQIKEVFRELRSAHGEYTIKIERLSSDTFVKKIEEEVLESRELYEFLDVKFTPKANTETPSKYKHFNPIFVYQTNDKDYTFKNGTRIEYQPDKSFAQILSYKNKTIFITNNRETISLENQDIANSIKRLLSEIHNKKNNRPKE